jgi:hypothetical protein
MVKREGKLEKEILLLGGVALAVIVGLELYKGIRRNKQYKNTQDSSSLPNPADNPEFMMRRLGEAHYQNPEYSNAAGRVRGSRSSAKKPLKTILTIPLCCLWNKRCCKDIKGPFRQVNNTLYPTR